MEPLMSFPSQNPDKTCSSKAAAFVTPHTVHQWVNCNKIEHLLKLEESVLTP